MEPIFLARHRFEGRDIDSFVVPATQLQAAPQAPICLPEIEYQNHNIKKDAPHVGLIMALEKGYDGYVIDEPYVQALLAQGVRLSFITYENVEAELARLSLDALLLIGGNFDSPREYYLHPENLPAEHHLSARSLAYLSAIAYAQKHHIPVLGICAGFQMLAGFFGAKMYVNVKNELHSQIAHKADKYQDAHAVKLVQGSKLAAICGNKAEIMVNSVHGEGVAEFSLPSIAVAARAEDGNVEAVEVKGDWFALGVQWHPEYLCRRSEDAAALFAALAEEAKKYRLEKTNADR